MHAHTETTSRTVDEKFTVLRLTESETEDLSRFVAWAVDRFDGRTGELARNLRNTLNSAAEAEAPSNERPIEAGDLVKVLREAPESATRPVLAFSGCSAEVLETDNHDVRYPFFVRVTSGNYTGEQLWVHSVERI